MLLKPPLIQLDNSQWVRWSRSQNTQTVESQHGKDLIDAVNQRAVLILFTVEHLLEFFAHNSDKVVFERINFLRNIEVLFSTKTNGMPGSLGSLVSVYNSEAQCAHIADIGRLREHVRENVFTGISPRKNFTLSDMHLSKLVAEARRHVENSQDEVAISRMKNPMDNNVKVRDAVRKGYRSSSDRRKVLSQIASGLEEHAKKFGDRRLKDPADLARSFFAQLLDEESRALSDDRDLIDQYIEEMDIPKELITEDLTNAELSKLFAISLRASVISNHSSVPKIEVFNFLYSGKSLCFNIIEGVENYRDENQRLSGGAIFDRNFISISPYVDAVYADAQTHDIVRRAKKDARFSRSIGDVRRAGSIAAVLADFVRP